MATATKVIAAVRSLRAAYDLVKQRPHLYVKCKDAEERAVLEQSRAEIATLTTSEDMTVVKVCVLWEGWRGWIVFAACVVLHSFCMFAVGVSAYQCQYLPVPTSIIAFWVDSHSAYCLLWFETRPHTPTA